MQTGVALLALLPSRTANAMCVDGWLVQLAHVGVSYGWEDRRCHLP